MRLTGSGDENLKSVLRAIADSSSGTPSNQGASASSTVNTPVIIPQGWNVAPYAYAAPPAPAYSCGSSESYGCGSSCSVTVPEVKKPNNKAAAAARRAEKSLKHAIEKLEKKDEEKETAKQTIEAIEKVKDEEKKH